MAPLNRMGLNVIVESEMVENVEGGDATSGSATQEPAVSPPEGEQEQSMETNPLASPVSPHEDDLLTGATTAGMEMEMASLRVASLPEGKEGNQ